MKEFAIVGSLTLAIAAGALLRFSIKRYLSTPTQPPGWRVKQAFVHDGTQIAIEFVTRYRHREVVSETLVIRTISHGSPDWMLDVSRGMLEAQERVWHLNLASI